MAISLPHTWITESCRLSSVCQARATLISPQLLGCIFDECFVEYCATILQHVRIVYPEVCSCDLVTDFTCSGWSAISPGEKHIVVSNLFDGLDFYSIVDRTLSHSVPCPMNQQNNALVPVLFNSNGSAVIVGGTSGSVRVLDSQSCETLQVLSHDGRLFTVSTTCCVSSTEYNRRRSYTGNCACLWPIKFSYSLLTGLVHNSR